MADNITTNTSAEKVDITPIIELLNNINFLAAAYSQIWVIKKIYINDEYTIAFVDERSGENKVIFVNPDSLMQKAIDEIVARGWFSVKEDYLLTNEKYFDEARVILTENDNAPINTTKTHRNIK